MEDIHIFKCGALSGGLDVHGCVARDVNPTRGIKPCMDEFSECSMSGRLCRRSQSHVEVELCRCHSHGPQCMVPCTWDGHTCDADTVQH